EDESAQWPMLIVTNNSLKDNIAAEVTRWKTDAEVLVLSGQASNPIPDGTEFIVTNTNILHHRADDIIAANPRGMIVDESQSLKSATTKVYKAAKRISETMIDRFGEDDAYIVLASATPL